MPTVFSYSLVSPFSATQHTLLGCDAVTGEVHRYDLSNLDTLVPIASQAEAEAGTNNAKMMTPLRTAQAIAASSFVKADGTVPMTGQLTLPASNPTSANHAARKAYVDAGDLWTQLADAAISNSAVIDVTGFSLADYHLVTVNLLHALPTATNSTALNMQVYRNGSLVSTGYTFVILNNSTGGAGGSGGTNQGNLTLTSGGCWNEVLTISACVSQPASGEIPMVRTNTFFQTSSGNSAYTTRVACRVTGGSGWVDGIRITAPVAFTANTGRLVVMGLRK
jgi:hypothetical protein